MDKKIVIEQDDREPESLQYLAKMNYDNIVFERKRLKIGDYKFGDVVIERKTIDDFALSILDGRLDKQVKEGMDIYINKYYLIIIGRIKDRISNINENCILGKICSLVYKHRVPIIMVDDEFQFLYCLKNLYEREVKNNGGEE